MLRIRILICSFLVLTGCNLCKKTLPTTNPMIENFLDTGLQLKQILPTSPIEVAVDCLQKIPLSKGDSPFTIYHNQVNFLEYGI